MDKKTYEIVKCSDGNRHTYWGARERGSELLLTTSCISISDCTNKLIGLLSPKEVVDTIEL